MIGQIQVTTKLLGQTFLMILTNGEQPVENPRVSVLAMPRGNELTKPNDYSNLTNQKLPF